MIPSFSWNDLGLLEGALQIYLFLGVVMGLEDVVGDCCRFCLMFIPVVD